jgi:hypothetical protein
MQLDPDLVRAILLDLEKDPAQLGARDPCHGPPGRGASRVLTGCFDARGCACRVFPGLASELPSQ